VLAGASAWASVYHYYAARVALPLVLVALLAGFHRSRPRLPRVLALLAVCAFTLATLAAATLWATRGPGRIWASVWPQYGGYVGNRGPQGAVQIAADMLRAVRVELPRAARAYFWSDRTADYFYGLEPPEPATGLGRYSAAGGLALLPVVGLGAIGVLVALARWRRDFLWFALAAAGLLVPCLSITTARRFLVFDLAWCAFAASGLSALLGLGPFRSRRAAAGLVPVLALVAYSFAVVITLGARLPPEHPAVIPFAESGFGDGRTCLGCLRNARRWEAAIRGGSFVVLFDTDIEREGRTIPGGLPLYGKIAALAAGKPRSFVPYYPLVANFDHDPPRVGQIYDGAGVDFASYLAGAIESERPAEIVWAFAQPTQWERWLADRLVAAGGERRPRDDPSLTTTRLRDPDPGFEVVTPWAARAGALAVVNDLTGIALETGCARADVVARERYAMPALVLAPRPPAAKTRWTLGSYHVIRHEDRDTPIAEAVGIAVDVGADGRERLDVLTRSANRVTSDPATAARDYTTPRFRPPIGLDCAARLSGEWWVVDPIAGRVERATGGAWAPPPGRWAGIAGDAAGRLVLAAADQTVHVFDVSAGRELRSFPARVPPSRRIYFAECSPIVAGDGWIATLDHFHRRLSVYAADGRGLGDVALVELPRMLAHQPTTVAANGGAVGVSTGYEGDVLTLGLDVVSACGATASPPGR
jgi:hypothetical protein